MSNLDKAIKIPQPECLDAYGLKPCTAEYLERMRNVCRQYCYDVKRFFSEHDPLEFGTVSEFVFRCIMQEKFMCQCDFSLDIIQVLADFFRMPDGMICYMRIVALMESSENIAQQLRECASKVPFPQVSEAPLRPCGKRVFSTDPCVPAALERLRTAFNRLRIKLTDQFRCCDPKCTGLVTEEKFQCVLNNTLVPEAGLTERQLDAVTNYYRACGEMIDYKRMSDMFESTLSLQEQIQMNYITKREDLMKPKAVNTLNEKEEVKVKEILVKLVKRADRHILTTLNAHFDKFAHRQSGEATAIYLKRFLSYLDADIAESEFALLCRKYATSDYNINFLQLVEDLDDVFHDELCPKEFAPPILGADGPPEEIEYLQMEGGAGKNSSVWGFGACPCASEDEQKSAEGTSTDSSRFYEGGPVCGGDARKPVLGKDYIKKGVGAAPGNRYAGGYSETHGAGKPSGIPVGRTLDIKAKVGASEAVNIRLLMERLQQYLYRFRIRAKEFFIPFDRYNSGKITANRFRRAMVMMGMGGTGRVSISEAEFDALINFYRVEKDPSFVCWRKFESDIESIFTQKGIEQLPTLVTPAQDRIINLPYPGATNMEDVPLKIRQLAKCSIARLRHRILIESCNFKYFLQGFDNTNNGYISRQQFKQVLSMLNYQFSPDELEAMSVAYCDERGFNYLKLLNDVEPRAKDAGWYAKYKTGRLYQLNRAPPQPQWKENDIQRIMYKIQARAVRYRPKLEDFLRDHDLYSNDRIKIVDFHRALDRAGFQLTPREVEVLSCCYRSPDDSQAIQWKCFLDAVESAFTVNNLERAPRLVPQPWRPLRQMDYDKEFTKEEYCLLIAGLRRLARRVNDRRLEFKPMFQDFDKPPVGLVSEDQFHRVLHTLGLANITTPSELEAILKRFEVPRGGKRDIDYIEFLARLDAITYVDPITLEEMSTTGVAWYKENYPLC